LNSANWGPTATRLYQDFKTFVLRGNVVELAVAVVIGVAFGNLITSFVEDMLTPVIAAVFGEPDFGSITFTINGSTFYFGRFLNAIFSFVAIALTLFFLVVVPMNALVARSRREPPPDPTTKKCSECLSEIPIGARRCAFCTSLVG
jgi:large conductance mechanosensitive channel